MRLLRHFPLSPASRFARLVLGEKKIAFELAPVGADDPAPCLEEPSGEVVEGAIALAEYLEEIEPAPALIPGGPLQRAEVRRLVQLFLVQFEAEVTGPVLYQKLSSPRPDMAAVRGGIDLLRAYLEAIGGLADDRHFLGGERLSLADFAAAAQLSCLDYLGDVPWRVSEPAKDWYLRIKSRPAFRPILFDTVQGLPPARTYTALDF